MSPLVGLLLGYASQTGSCDVVRKIDRTPKLASSPFALPTINTKALANQSRALAVDSEVSLTNVMGCTRVGG